MLIHYFGKSVEVCFELSHVDIELDQGLCLSTCGLRILNTVVEVIEVLELPQLQFGQEFRAFWHQFN